MASPRLIAAALAVTALAGCVSLTPAQRAGIWELFAKVLKVYEVVAVDLEE